jgi:UPF0042 nucleotide-binding protein
MPDRPHLVVITGMGGAGRSLAAKALEDIGFFVVDNLPSRLIGDVVAEADLPEGGRHRLAVVIDTRAGLDFEQLDVTLRRLAADGVTTTVLFLDAEDETLATRYRESRRPHPVPGPTLGESITQERVALEGVRGLADLIVDTSDTNVHELRHIVTDAFSAGVGERPMKVSVTSFGFKHGVPRVMDVMFDVRFLPNPHWVEALRPLTGLDEPVRAHVFAQSDTTEFMTLLMDLLRFVVPRYRREGKAYLTIGIGCTGGRHRSVALAEEVASLLGPLADIEVSVRHRDIER